MAIRLLVADDAPFIREIVRAAVERHGMDVIAEATDGLEAVELTLRLEPDVVLMDMVMPKQNGLKAAEAILERRPQQKIIAFSTLNEKSMMADAIGAGCVDFLAKPFEIDQLLYAINKAVQEN